MAHGAIKRGCLLSQPGTYREFRGDSGARQAINEGTGRSLAAAAETQATAANKADNPVHGEHEPDSEPDAKHVQEDTDDSDSENESESDEEGITISLMISMISSISKEWTLESIIMVCI